MDRPPLWACPECGRTFAAVGQVHTCARLGDLDAHFAGSDPAVRETFDLLRSAVEPIDVLAEKTRIAFHLRMSFAAFQPRRRWLAGHLVLAREAGHPAIRRIEVYSPHKVVHAFRLARPAEVDEPFLELLAEAREVGEQRHLMPPR